MRRDPRKQPWQTFPFWFLILSGLAMTVAWKLDLLRPKSSAVAVDETAVEAELAPDWASSVESEDVAELVDEPTEPLVAEESPRSFPDESEPGSNAAPEQSEPTADGMPPEAAETTVESESPADANPFSRTDARLVSASREKPASRAFAPSQTLAEASDLSQPASTKSPFGPAKVEFQGTRPRNSNGQPAANAAGASEPATPHKNPDAITQTASIDSTHALDATTPELKPKAHAADMHAPFDFSTIDQLIADGEDVEANFQLSNLYWKRPEIRDQLMKRLSIVAYRIYFAPQPHYMDGHVVQAGDVLQNIAKDYDVSWEYLAKLNRTDAKHIRPGQKLKVIKGPFAAVVDLSDREMTIHSHGHFVARFEVGIGQDSSAPVGTLKVLEKLRDPTYYGPGGVIAHEDPLNPLGEYWLDLGDNYGIHGTIHEKSMGEAESQGCIRMKNRDIADVYDLLTVGSEVIIRR